MNTTESSYGVCSYSNYRQTVVNVHSILTEKVCYNSLAKKYPTAVINPGSTYRAPIYSPFTTPGQCFHEEGALNKRFFFFFLNLSMEWMLVCGQVLFFYLVCLGKCVSICVRGELFAPLVHSALNVFTLLIML